MKLGLRERLFLVSAGVLLVGGGAIDVVLGRALSADVSRELGREAKARASLVAREVTARDLESLERGDALADALGAR
ncbi:MAG TPA: hypothetical protein VL400_15550, partial [Polyangiaceae bacterium]|nr:hypothetical protein [Polyangiaceae bacterium]